MVPEITDAEFRAAIFPAFPFGPLPNQREKKQWEQIEFLFGQATLWAQALEDGIARFVMAAEAHWKQSGITSEQIQMLTLGALQREYCRYCHLREYHQKEMARALRTRNHLAHSFYRRRMILLQTEQGRNDVIRELQAAIELFIQERDEVYWNLSCLTGQSPL
jgi:hypothetical protein